ncbi:MAG TPA: toll/interleukin-1 receptor domain-containing protein [Dehalococcoidia bacterium]|nr:toll/interleukin-1 receptor domain-containing protein [Dehalococcoidia bacterium]
MAHDVFVSYASDDKPTADAVCAALEARGIRAWIAPRDILPGSDWSEAIIDAIENARVMVLVFSARANASRQIIREVERAVSKGLTIIPLRIEEVVPGRNLEYFLGTPHWLDAMTPPLERHLTYLCETVQFLLERGERPEPLPIPQRTKYDLEWVGRNKLLVAAAIVPVLLVAAFALGLFGGGDAADADAIDARLVGAWQVQSGGGQSDGSTVDWTVAQKPDGTYSSRTVVKDDGRAQFDAGLRRLSLTPDGAPAGYFRSFDWNPGSSNIQLQTAAVIPPNLTFFLTASGIAPNVLFTIDEWRRTDGSGTAAGRWEFTATYGSFQWQLTLDISSQGLYTFEATLEDSGTIRTTTEGSFTQVSKAAGIIEGQYEVVDRDTILFKNGAVVANPVNAQVTWKRASR